MSLLRIPQTLLVRSTFLLTITSLSAGGGSPVLSSVLFFFVAGPAESLFKESYYQLMKAALRGGGILCSQGNLIFHHICVLKIVERLMTDLFFIFLVSS